MEINPEDCLCKGENGASKCRICERRIPKNILRFTFSYRDGCWSKHMNLCSKCINAMAFRIKKDKKVLAEWDKKIFLECI